MPVKYSIVKEQGARSAPVLGARFWVLVCMQHFEA
jgi:hypothetical protein